VRVVVVIHMLQSFNSKVCNLDDCMCLKIREMAELGIFNT